MKGTEHFKQTIKAFLDERAANDELFAQSYKKPAKSLDECITYVLNWVQKSGCCGFSDEEIFGQCIHYYDEDNINVGKPIDCNVTVNHHVALTEAEKAEVRQNAIRQYQNEEIQKMKNRKKVKQTTQADNSPTLFDF